MRQLRALTLRLRNLFRARRIEADFVAELETHVALDTEAGIRNSLAPSEARRQALIHLGGAERVRQAHRQRRTLPWFDCLMPDLRYALRRLGKSRAFTLTSVLTLALGVGANTAVFSMVESVLLRPLPYQHPDRLVVIWQTDAAHRTTGAWFDMYREFEAWRQNSRSFEKLAALSWGTGGKTILWHGKPIDILPIPASADFFSMLGIPAQFGRTFNEDDQKNGCTMVLSYSFWTLKLGEPGNVIGQSMKLGDTACQVVGVMPKSFAFYPNQTDAWTLITPTSEFARDPWHTMTGAFGLLKPGVTRAAAEAELAAIQSRVAPDAPADLTLMRTAAPVVLALQSNFTWLAGRNLRTGLWVCCPLPGSS